MRITADSRLKMSRANEAMETREIGHNIKKITELLDKCKTLVAMMNQKALELNRLETAEQSLAIHILQMRQELCEPLVL